jgi:hypothetical protein
MASSLEDLLEFSCVFPFEHLSIHKIPFERVWDGLGSWELRVWCKGGSRERSIQALTAGFRDREQ